MSELPLHRIVGIAERQREARNFAYCLDQEAYGARLPIGLLDRFVPMFRDDMRRVPRLHAKTDDGARGRRYDSALDRIETSKYRLHLLDCRLGTGLVADFLHQAHITLCRLLVEGGLRCLDAKSATN